MSIKPRKKGQPADSVRALVLARCKAKGISQQRLSETIGMNSSYINQFIWKGAPDVLPDDLRPTIASILEVDEKDLRHPPKPPRNRNRFIATSSPDDQAVSRSEGERGEGVAVLAVAPPGQPQLPLPSSPSDDRLTPERTVIAEMAELAQRLAPTIAAAAKPALAPAPVPAPGYVPVYKDTDEIDQAIIGHRKACPTISLWLTSPQNRLRTGDQVVATSEAPARVGDLVVLVGNNHVLAIGELKAASREELQVAIDDKDGQIQRFDRKGVEVFRVLSATFA